MSGPGDSWATPPPIITALHRFWPGGVDLDPCSNEQSIVGARVAYVEGELGTKDGGLAQPWAGLASGKSFVAKIVEDGRILEDAKAIQARGEVLKSNASKIRGAPVCCYMNPPFSAPARWYQQLREQAMTGLLDGIGMCPVATSTRWWQDHVWQAAAVCFLFQRPAFLNLNGEPTSGNRYDCAMPYYGPEVWRFRQVFAELGEVRT